MGHFVYEIDERSLRLKLKGMETPIPVDAWEKFLETNRQHKAQPKQKFNAPSIPLNRHVLVPVLGALVIVALSVLLFNFISVTANAEKPSEVVQEPAIITTTVTAVNVVPEPAATPVLTPTANPQVAAKTTPAVTTPTIPSKTTTPGSITPAAAANYNRYRATPTNTAQPKTVEEEMEHLPDIRPVLTADERPVEIKVD